MSGLNLWFAYADPVLSGWPPAARSMLCHRLSCAVHDPIEDAYRQKLNKVILCPVMSVQAWKTAFCIEAMLLGDVHWCSVKSDNTFGNVHSIPYAQ